MLHGKTPDQRAVLTIRDQGGAKLALVAYLDGDYGIYRNGEPLEGCRWVAKDLDACVVHLLGMAGKLAQANA